MSEKGSNFLLKQTDVAAVVTFTNATEVITYAAHGMSAGDPFVLTNSGGALPAELTASQVYYAVDVAGGQFRPYLTKAQAIAGVGVVTFTDNGTGTHSAQKLITVAGMRTTSFTINAEEVDVTTKDSAGWKELLANGGVVMVALSASGVFQDDDAFVRLETAAQDKVLDTYSLRFESGDEYFGLFQATSAERTGEHNGEVTYSVSLESSGTTTFINNV